MFTITPHTAERLEERDIASAWVEVAEASPDWTEPDPHAGRVRHYRAIPEFGNRVLRVVTETTGAAIEVVTAHFDRAATKRSTRQ